MRNRCDMTISVGEEHGTRGGTRVVFRSAVGGSFLDGNVRIFSDFNCDSDSAHDSHMVQPFEAGTMRATSIDDHAENTQSSLTNDCFSAYVRDARAMERLYRLAERYGELPRDSLVARELVMEVIEDMWMREAKWNPGGELGPQIGRHVVRRACRLRNEGRPRRKKRDGPRPVFVPLDNAPLCALVVEPVYMRLDDGDYDAAELVPRIFEYARDDKPVLQLLAHYARGEVLRRDVISAGMTEWTYRAARKRLDDYAEMAKRAVAATSTASQPAEPAGAATPVAPALVVARGERARRAVRQTVGGKSRLRSA
jgi:hypothetical protein